MAISKIGSKAITDSTVVAADISPGTISNDKLANTSITVNSQSVTLGGSGTISVKDISWQSVVTTNTTMVAGYGYFVDTTSGAITMTLPASPSAGDLIAIKDYAETFGTNNLTIGRNGSNIQGAANDSVINTNRASLILVYVDGTKGWLYTNESNVADLKESALYVTATGGTVTTSGDDKIHTFTSSGCFVVSCAGRIVSTLGSTTVEYLVIAGGGGSGHDRGGGGGAGGYRTNHSNSTPSPRTGGLSISAQTYPITVGGGGGGGTPSVVPGNGSNSVFSSITSAGGGFGARQNDSPAGNGGSGGGGAGGGGAASGSGNTPPVSPPQGNNGGNGNATESGPVLRGGGGGGGAGATGTTATTSQVGNGGAGASSDITGSSVTRAGGGGGGGQNSASSGGPGGGSPGPGNTASGVNGTANTGGGAGAGGCSSPSGATGGSGLVVIRYKYQN